MKFGIAKQTRRNIKAGWRDSLLLFREFWKPLSTFILVMIVGGLIYYWLSQNSLHPIKDPIEAIYVVLLLSFLQPIQEFPNLWYLQIFYFLMPLLGISCIAQGLADFGTLFFNRRARGKGWEMAVASTFNQHTILVGLGHLGYRVVRQLHEMDEDVVVIELSSRPELSESIRRLGIPVIQDDGTSDVVLESSGIRQARAIILCTQQDSLNLQIAVKARSLNPDIRVIIRIFDDDFAQALRKQFGFIALSATGMAAPIFAASAADVDITPPISIEGQPNSLARLKINPTSRLEGVSARQIEDDFRVSIVWYYHKGQAQYHPPSNILMDAGDSIAVLGHPNQINLIVQENHS